MENIKNSNDLKKFVYPALRSKKEELKKLGYLRMLEDDIWKVLYEEEWSKKGKIALCDIVDDILNYNNEKLYTYFKTKNITEVIELPKLKEN